MATSGDAIRAEGGSVPLPKAHRFPVVLAVVGILIGASAVTLVPGPAGAGAVAASAPNDAPAAAAVAAAQRSLSVGAGPAAGTPMVCQTASNGSSLTCRSADTTAASSVPSSAASTPKARWGAAMTYDSADGYVLLFGGSSADDTWTFAHGLWTHLTPSVHPPAVSAAGMAYDAADGYVLWFGDSETWTFLHGSWSNITPTTLTASNQPSARSGASVVYDAQDGYTILFGGNHLGRFFNDTWKFAAGSWTNITGTAGGAPPCRFDGAMADDAAAGYVLLFGGAGKVGAGCGPGGKNVTLADTWSFVGGKWTALHPAESPPACWNANAAFDVADDYLVLFGGIDTSDMALQQTWKFASGDWSLVTVATYPPTSPPARFSASMTYDALDGYLLLFGGLSEPQHNAPLLGDTWSYRDSVWTNLTPNPTPPFRSSMAMTYDAEDGYVLLFGGAGTSGTLGDTWKFVAGVWLELKPTRSPPARSGASIAYDAKDRYVLLFGGVGASGSLGDTWEFVRGEWTNLTPKLPNATNTPSPRYDAAMAYDGNPKVESVVLFGGEGSSGALADTWEFVHGKWSEDHDTTSPAARASAAMAYDAASGDAYLLLFGGVAGGSIYGDTWEFATPGGWTQLSPSGGSVPGPRYAADLVYDMAAGYLLLFGGANASSVLNDTWTYEHDAWTDLAPTTFPPGRSAAGMAYDAADSLVFLFSGRGSTTSTLIVRTDSWVFSSGAWTNMSGGPVRLSTELSVPGVPLYPTVDGTWLVPAIRPAGAG